MFSAGYQIAFYFRKTSQKHVVLLKVSPPHSAPPRPARTPLTQIPPTSQNRQFTSSRPAKAEPSPAPRQQGKGKKRAREGEDDDVVVVKPEPGTEEEGLLDALHAPPQEDERMDLGGEDEEDEGDEKPVLKVNCEQSGITS